MPPAPALPPDATPPAPPEPPLPALDIPPAALPDCPAFEVAPADASEPAAPACVNEPAELLPAVLPSLPSSLAQPPAPPKEKNTTHTAAPAMALAEDMRPHTMNSGTGSTFGATRPRVALENVLSER